MRRHLVQLAVIVGVLLAALLGWSAGGYLGAVDKDGHFRGGPRRHTQAELGRCRLG